MGTDPDRIYAEVCRLLTRPRAYRAMANAINPYGDGQAAQRTIGAIEHMFGLADRPQPFEPKQRSAAGITTSDRSFAKTNDIRRHRQGVCKRPFIQELVRSMGQLGVAWMGAGIPVQAVWAAAMSLRWLLRHKG